MEGSPRLAIRLAREESRTIELGLRCERWGAYVLGGAHLRAYDRFGVLVHDQGLGRHFAQGLHLHAETLRHCSDPRRQVFARNQVARSGAARASSSPTCGRSRRGDRLRRINWRASAAPRRPLVNEAHPERNADIVLFLDVFAEVRRSGPGTSDLAVGAAGSLAERYLRDKG